jgi:hypothetical protein
MKKPLDQDQVWLGYDIEVEKGCILKPLKMRFWQPEDYSHHKPESPFHYFSDALVGLSLVHLNPYFKNPFHNQMPNYGFCFEAWHALEPHHALFQKSQVRVNALRQFLKPTPDHLVEYFERNFSDTLESAMHPWGVDFAHLAHLIEAVDYLETKMEQPLLYNFNLKLNRETQEKLHYLYSMLFNLRALIALDYNSHCLDSAHESCRVDSITDYLSKAEYVANDAVLYYQFQKVQNQMKPEARKFMHRSFKNFSHNGFCLIEALPQSFLKNLRIEELEESLYIVQMDWLLGTDAGLLFRIREELYGVLEGYHKVFWPDANGKSFQKQSHLHVNCQLGLEDLYPQKKTG